MWHGHPVRGHRVASVSVVCKPRGEEWRWLAREMARASVRAKRAHVKRCHVVVVLHRPKGIRGPIARLVLWGHEQGRIRAR